MDEFEEINGLFESFGAPAEQSPTSTEVDIFDDLSHEFEFSDSDEEQSDTEQVVNARIEEVVRNYETVNTRESDSDRVTDDASCNRASNISSCKVDCLFQFDKASVDSHILSMREIEKNEAEMFITGSVHFIATDETLKGKRRKRARFRYTFHGKPICKEAFMYVNDIGSKALRNLLDHFTTNGAIPRTHGNTGRKPQHALGYNDCRLDFMVCRYQLLTYASSTQGP
ncbi:uncharacterized protein LOC132713122 [Ruditapes philippinarum]|uniref:uncharacterized protein LOC132713122 n=1 Tax=Ruditapes philippinarum TaxID=129788 RepID=UPI00295B0501|nr:uncharacterized protein LOC132713122 [Ruditapes philippinarum]